MRSNQRHIILFDGVCNFCNRWVNFVIRKDKRKVFRFAPLQSAAGKSLLEKTGLGPDHFRSFVYIEGENYFVKSDAALRVAKVLGGGWGWLYIFVMIPKFVRDGLYNFIATNRYKWFGKKEECMVPTPELQERFL